VGSSQQYSVRSVQQKISLIMIKEFEMVSCVNVRGEWIPLDSVEFVDISEDMQGYDLVTFIYEGEQRQSRITTRPR
jgi:hypothetical protein